MKTLYSCAPMVLSIVAACSVARSIPTADRSAPVDIPIRTETLARAIARQPRDFEIPEWYASLPCECVSEVGPYPWRSPIAASHTESLGPDGGALDPCDAGDVECMIDHATPVGCNTTSDCYDSAVNGCRHAGCDTVCPVYEGYAGICLFQTYPPCYVDTCILPGHNTDCASDVDCIDTPYVGTHCDMPSGKCIVEAQPASGAYCVGMGDLQNIPDGGVPDAP